MIVDPIVGRVGDGVVRGCRRWEGSSTAIKVANVTGDKGRSARGELTINDGISIGDVTRDKCLTFQGGAATSTPPTNSFSTNVTRIKVAFLVADGFWWWLFLFLLLWLFLLL